MKGFYYNGADIQVSGIDYAIIDSGTSLLYIGQSDYIKFIGNLLAEAPDLNCQDDVYCFSDINQCDEYYSVLKPITIRLGNNHYTIPPEGYMFSGNGV